MSPDTVCEACGAERPTGTLCPNCAPLPMRKSRTSLGARGALLVGALAAASCGDTAAEQGESSAGSDEAESGESTDTDQGITNHDGEQVVPVPAYGMPAPPPPPPPPPPPEEDVINHDGEEVVPVPAYGIPAPTRQPAYGAPSPSTTEDPS